jgi:hypothetical protein
MNRPRRSRANYSDLLWDCSDLGGVETSPLLFLLSPCGDDSLVEAEVSVDFGALSIVASVSRPIISLSSPAMVQLLHILPPSGITLHSMFGQSQTFPILTKRIGKTINNYETKYMQYENIFYDNSNDGYFIL